MKFIQIDFVSAKETNGILIENLFLVRLGFGTCWLSQWMECGKVEERISIFMMVSARNQKSVKESDDSTDSKFNEVGPPSPQVTRVSRSKIGYFGTFLLLT
jgi:hypothetical protein